MLDGIVLIVLGALCLPSLVAEKSPKAKDLLDKITVYQGWIGLVVFVWGVRGIIFSILGLGLIGSWPLQWATVLAASIVSFAGGAILGYGMIQKYLLSRMSEEAQAKALELKEKLVSYQAKIGIGALITGVWVILYFVLLRGMLSI